MSQRPKALFIASQPFFEWRGSPIRLGYDVQAIRDNGYDVDFLTLPIGERRVIEGVRIVRAPNLFFAKKISIGPSLLKFAFDGIMFIQALGMICRRHYDVVHGVEDCGILGLMLGRLSGSKVVFEKHSDSKSYKGGLVMRGYAAVERFVMRHVDAVIGTGPGLVAQVKEFGRGTPGYHISDIPSSLTEPDAAGVASARAEMDMANDEILATYVGSFAYYQGIDLLFESMPLALARCPKLRFIIIGGSEAEISQWRRWLEARGCGDQVSFIGKRPPDRLPCYLAASDILLSPRIAGVNTPLKLLDYLKVSRAIVATDHEANRLILDEKTALLTALTPEAFSDGIVKVAEDAALRTEISSNCRRLVDEKYNFNVFREGLRLCYADITQKAGGRV